MPGNGIPLCGQLSKKTMGYQFVKRFVYSVIAVNILNSTIWKLHILRQKVFHFIILKKICFVVTENTIGHCIQSFDIYLYCVLIIFINVQSCKWILNWECVKETTTWPKSNPRPLMCLHHSYEVLHWEADFRFSLNNNVY